MFLFAHRFLFYYFLTIDDVDTLWKAAGVGAHVAALQVVDSAIGRAFVYNGLDAGAA